jgi:hypothetical protein
MLHIKRLTAPSLPICTKKGEGKLMAIQLHKTMPNLNDDWALTFLNH